MSIIPSADSDRFRVAVVFSRCQLDVGDVRFASLNVVTNHMCLTIRNARINQSVNLFIDIYLFIDFIMYWHICLYYIYWLIYLLTYWNILQNVYYANWHLFFWLIYLFIYWLNFLNNLLLVFFAFKAVFVCSCIVGVFAPFIHCRYFYQRDHAFLISS